MTTNEKAAPPPAAARGDVRGLVADRQAWFESEIAKAERRWIDGFHDRYEAGDDVPSMAHFVALWLAERTDALAAEGVQAGEVECDCPGKGKDDPALHAPNCPARLSQQPEARGVVDEAMVRKVLDFKPSWSGVTVREYLIDGGAKFWSPSSYLWNDAGSKPYRIVQEALTAALTGERNG